MEAFTTHTGRAVPLRRSNVDTDQIIPAHWLKKVTRDGFEDGLFEAWRKDPEFVLNRPEREGATVLVAGPDFGTGSSREHAVWALQNYGFKAVISARFADIFRGNSLKNGLLTVVLDQETVDALWELTEADPTVEVTVDLEAREVRAGDITAAFELDENARWRLLNGLDDISLTLRNEADIAGYEAGPATSRGRSRSDPARTRSRVGRLSATPTPRLYPRSPRSGVQPCLHPNGPATPHGSAQLPTLRRLLSG
ncbi:hypothetical protein ACE1SV_46220 [Streptomyces sp. E-15]